MSTSPEEKKKLTLKCTDNTTFSVDVAAAMQMQTIKHLIEDDCAADEIPIPNVQPKVLAKVIEYCTNHINENSESEEEEKEKEKRKAFDMEFVDVDAATLFEYVLAANYLDVKGLLELTCQAVADYIKDKSVEEVRRIFNIENDFTAEEEAEVRKENAWAFE